MSGTWQRQSLVAFSAGYDAVVQLSASLLTAKLRSSLDIPIFESTYDEPSDFHAAIPVQHNNTISGNALFLASKENNSVEIVNSKFSLHHVGRFRSEGAAGVIKLAIRNHKASPITIVVQPAIGVFITPTPKPITIAPQGIGLQEIYVDGIPFGKNDLELHIVDISGSSEQSQFIGELTVDPPGFPFPEGGIPPLEGEQEGPPANWPENLPYTEEVVIREEYVSRTTVKASPSPSAVDCVTSTSTDVVLISPMRFQYKIEHIISQLIQQTIWVPDYETITDPDGRTYKNYKGWKRLVSHPITREQSATFREYDTTGTLKIRAPLHTQIHQTTQFVDLIADLNDAILSFDSLNNADAQRIYDQKVQPSLSNAVRTKGQIALSPQISLLGSISPLSTGGYPSVAELSISHVDIQPLPNLSSNIQPCFSLGFRLTGSSVPVGTMQSFINQDDYAVVISGTIIKAIVSFRWKSGEYPHQYIGRPIPDAYKEGDKTIEILLYPSVNQTDILDAQGTVIAGIRLLGKYFGQTFSEDQLLLGGHCNIDICKIVKKDNLTEEVPEEVSNAYKQKHQAENVVILYPFYLSNVNQPTPHPEATYEAWLQSMRKGVTGYLSRPFAAIYNISLSIRQANGIENLLLSRGRIIDMK